MIFFGGFDMEKLLLNHFDKEYMKMAMLKHEETFREQVYELHRLYQIQKTLMKDISRNERNNQPDQARKCFNLEQRRRPVEEFNNVKKSVIGKFRVSEIEDDQSTDLELTLGPRIYYKRKIKAEIQSDSGLSFSSSTSTGSSHIKGISRENHQIMLSQQKWGMENMSSLSNQDRLNSPPWLFQALSLNIT